MDFNKLQPQVDSLPLAVIVIANKLATAWNKVKEVVASVTATPSLALATITA